MLHAHISLMATAPKKASVGFLALNLDLSQQEIQIAHFFLLLEEAT